jgi:hypothetical protein
MSSQGPKDATVAATSNANGGTLDWTNPNLARSSTDGLYATAPGGGGSTQTTYLLQLSAYGFTVPGDATILGVTVRVIRGASGAGVRDASLSLYSGGVVISVDKADLGTDWPTSVAGVNYGGAADVWGATLTGVIIDAADFTVALSATVPDGITASVDAMTVTITYTDNAPTKPGWMLPPATPEPKRQTAVVAY